MIGGKAGNVQPLSQSVSDRTRVASVVFVCVKRVVTDRLGECRHDRNRKWIEEDDSSILSSASEEV